MRQRILKGLFRLCLAGVLWVTLSGCLLRFVFVDVKSELENAEMDAANAAITAELGAILCQLSSSPPNTTDASCADSADGATVTSTVSLYSNEVIKFTFEDPLILEVPEDVISVTASYDTGSGALPLTVGRGDSFPVTPTQRITAEVGTTFLFFNLPGGIDNSHDLDFTLSFSQLVPHGQQPPITVKGMLAGLVIVQWQSYYVPLLPCVTDFADIPPVTLPYALTPQNLSATLGDLLRNHSASPCGHKTYDFTGAQPPAGLAFLPLVQ